MTAPTRQRCPEHGIPDCSPLLNGCTWRPRSADVQAFMELPAPTAPRGGIRFVSPYERAREQYAAQLVEDVRDALGAADCACSPGDPTCEDWTGKLHRWETLAAAVVRLVYPTLEQVKDRDDELGLMNDARRVCDVGHKLSLDGDGYRQEDVHALVAGLLRDLRRLYDDAQNVREQYGAACREYEREAGDAHQQVGYLLWAVARCKRAVRPVTRQATPDQLLGALTTVKRTLRPITTGRQ